VGGCWCGCVCGLVGLWVVVGGGGCYLTLLTLVFQFLYRIK